MPMVSILMPVKNAAPWLVECLESIQTQSFEQWELIAIDDSSSDTSFTILKDYSKKDHRIQCAKNKGQGILPALQHAFSRSTGQWITRMDADDRMPTQKLEWFITALQANPEAIVTGQVSYFSNTSVSTGYRKYEKWLNERCIKQDHWNQVYRECVIASANWMCSRSSLEATGAFEQLHYPEDYDLVLRWKTLQKRVIAVPHLTHLWREHPARTSRHSAHYQQDAFFQLKLAHFASHEWNPEEHLIVWGSDTKGKKTANILNRLKVPFIWMDLVEKQTPQGTVKPIDTLHHLTGRKVILSSVYPSGNAMRIMKEWMKEQGFREGDNFWFL